MSASGLQFIEFLLLLIFQVESQTATQRQCSNLNHPFSSCNNNSVLRVTKSTEMYQVTLLVTEWQCFNEFCLTNDQYHWQRNITCSETCRACHQLKPRLGNVKNTEIHICICARIGTYVALPFARLGIGEPNLGVSSIVYYIGLIQKFSSWNFIYVTLHADCGTNTEVCEVNVDTFLDVFCAHATFTRNSTTTYNPSKVQCPTSTITVTVYRTTEAQYYHRSGNFYVKKLSYDKFSCKKISVETTPYHISVNSTH